MNSLVKPQSRSFTVSSNELKIPFQWSDRRPILLDRFFYIPAHYDKHEEAQKFAWSDPDLFGNENPVSVEYCSGNGQWIGEKAKESLGVNWIAVEKRFDRARAIWRRLKREAIGNLYVVCGDARIFTRYYLPKNSVSAVYVNFPDPWPKRKHEKNRLIRAEFIRDVEVTLRPYAEMVCVTDHEGYTSGMIEAFRSLANWQSLFPAPFFITAWEGYGGSFFREVWEKEGKTIHFMRHRFGS